MLSIAVLEALRLALPRHFLRLNDLRWRHHFRNGIALSGISACERELAT